MAANIAVKDEALAREWVAKAQALNERAQAANKMVATLLRQLDEGAAGEIVDKLVQFGNQALEFAQQIFDGVTQMCDAISGVITLVKDTVGSIVDTVKGIFSALG